jgi:hypothetical protein
MLPYLPLASSSTPSPVSLAPYLHHASIHVAVSALGLIHPHPHRPSSFPHLHPASIRAVVGKFTVTLLPSYVTNYFL